MSSRTIDYTIAISNSIYLVDWVISRGPRYLVHDSLLTLGGEAEYVLGIF